MGPTGVGPATVGAVVVFAAGDVDGGIVDDVEVLVARGNGRA